MANLVAATLFFLATHLGIASTGLRGRLIGRIGEPAYRGLFSLLALAGIVWMVMAYRAADYVSLWNAGRVGRYLAFAMIAAAFYFAVAGLTTPNPSLARAAATLQRERPARGVFKITRHPLMWGVGFWALAHLIVSGHLAGLIFFGGLGMLAILGSYLLDLRKGREGGQAWAKFAAETSWLPYGALIGRRTSSRPVDFDWWRGLLALVVLLAFWRWGHAWLIGVPLVGR